MSAPQPMTPDVITPLSQSLILSNLASAYPGVIDGTEMPPPLLAALGAQSCLETASGAAMHCFNYGNIRGTYSGAWTSFRAGEGHGVGAIILQPGPANSFRAYPSALEGAADFIRFLCTATGSTPNRYQAAVDAACRGDWAGYVHGLHQAGYFTASESSYAHGLMGVEAMLAKLPILAGRL